MGKSTVIKNGRVIDGTGAPAFAADVRFENGRITAIGPNLDGDEIIHVVAQAFGLLIEGHDKASALGAIEGFLHEEARAGRR
ncbi:MAG: hypothetical protein ACO29A_00365, partial [Ilumatobacteraceae bacterium]